MKRYLNIILFIVIGIIVLPIFVEASSVTCVYKYNSTTVSVKYKYGTKISYSEDYANGNDNNKVKKVNIENKDIVDSEGNISCPNVSITKSSTGQKNRFKITLTASTSGTYVGEMKNLVDDGKEKENAYSNNQACIYKNGSDQEFKLILNNNVVEVIMVGSKYENYCSPTIDVDVDVFKNGCPSQIYTQTVPKHEGSNCRGKLIVSSDKILTENDNPTSLDGTENVDDGEIIITPDQTPNNNYNSLCSNASMKQVAKVIGYILQVVRWVVPFILIVLGMVDFARAAISSDEKEMGKAAGTLVRRLIAGIIVFFIPTIAMSILNLVEVTKGIEKETDTNFGACTKCIFDPYNSCP